jgi:hypothetical protein
MPAEADSGIAQNKSSRQLKRDNMSKWAVSSRLLEIKINMNMFLAAVREP